MPRQEWHSIQVANYEYNIQYHKVMSLILSFSLPVMLKRFLKLSNKFWDILIQAVYLGYLEVVQKATEELNQSFFTFKTQHPEVDNILRGMQLKGIQIMDCCCELLHDEVYIYSFMLAHDQLLQQLRNDYAGSTEV